MNIEKTLNVDGMLNKCYDHGVYIEDNNLHVQRWNSFDEWDITDLSNALAAGKTCRIYNLKNRGDYGNLDITNWMCQQFDGDFRKVFDFCETLNFEATEWGGSKPIYVDNIEIYRSDIKSKGVFSPFALDQIKPLKSMPSKWTMRHVRAAIINGQFKDLKCDGVYSDDYAFDAGCNYQKGDIKSPLAFIRRIIESPSGWHCFYGSEGSVSVCCHSFDNNSFVPVIN